MNQPKEETNVKQVYVLKNRYVDSVTLMGVAEKIAKLDGV